MGQDFWYTQYKKEGISQILKRKYVIYVLREKS